jgi:hypothetical protein
MTDLLTVMRRRVAQGSNDQILVFAGPRAGLRESLISQTGQHDDVCVVAARARNTLTRTELLDQLLVQARATTSSSRPADLLVHVDSCHDAGGLSFREPDVPVGPVQLLISDADLLPNDTLEHVLKMHKVSSGESLPLHIAVSVADHARFAVRCARQDADACMMLRSACRA